MVALLVESRRANRFSTSDFRTDCDKSSENDCHDCAGLAATVVQCCCRDRDHREGDGRIVYILRLANVSQQTMKCCIYTHKNCGEKNNNRDIYIKKEKHSELEIDVVKHTKTNLSLYWLTGAERNCAVFGLPDNIRYFLLLPSRFSALHE